MTTKELTTNAGAPAGPRGPALLQDIWFLEKMAHFDREVIPERRMHAKGSGAYAHAHDHTPMEIKLRHVGNCTKADPAYGAGVAKALGIALGGVPNETSTVAHR